MNKVTAGVKKRIAGNKKKVEKPEKKGSEETPKIKSDKKKETPPKETAKGTKGQKAKKPKISDEVIVLNSKNFNKMVMQSPDIWMIEFYAPWCGHCKKLEPEWKAAAHKLKGIVKFGKVNADEASNKDLASRFSVNGFPTIKYFKHGKKSDGKAKTYTGAREESSLVELGYKLADKSNIEPDILEIYNQNIYDENCKGKKICVITFVPNIYDTNKDERNKLLGTLKAVAKKNRKSPLTFFWLQAGE